MPETKAQTVEPTWESLIQTFRCPDWFRDAKFGVWSHWGPQAVPGCGDWYARYMYMQEHEMHRHHCRTYGHPSKVGFKDIIGSWRAEKLDPESLIGFYADNGAKYFMGQAAHCDNFDLFNSRHHSWNSVNYGPKRDILGEYAKAARNAGLRWGFSEHLVWSYGWFNTNKGSDQTGPYAGVPYDGNDPACAELYHDPHDDTRAEYPRNPSKKFVNRWLSRMKDAMGQYEPDIFYTDGGIPFGEVGLELMAYFYNQVTKRHGSAEGVYTYKDALGRRPGLNIHIGAYQAGAGVEDLEHGVLGDINAAPWQTDTSTGPWYWNPREAYKSPTEVVHTLTDIVSKNGNMLLNYTQRPDGSLDDETVWIAESVGRWLSINGAAIYSTRPWTSFGEGATVFKPGEFGLVDATPFRAEDFRFTTGGGDLFAIALGKPKTGERWLIKSLADRKTLDVKAVTMLGYEGPLDWQQTPDGLYVTPPATLPCEIAWSLRIAH